MQHLSSKIQALGGKIDQAGETHLRELKKHHDSIMDLITEYSKKPDNYFSRVELIKKLNRVAMKIQAAHASGSITEKINDFDEALRALKKWRFKAANEALQDLSSTVSMIDERAALMQEYKKRYLSMQSRRLDILEKIAVIESKQALFQGEVCSEEEYVKFTNRLEEHNKIVKALLSDFISKTPSRKAVSIMLDVHRNPELGLPTPPERAEALKQFLAINEIGRSTISQLLDLRKCSRERLEHYLQNVKEFLEAVSPNLLWLESLSSLKFAAALQIDLDISASDLRIRVPKLISATSTVARTLNIKCDAQINFLRELRRAAIKGDFDRVRTKHFQKMHGSDARMFEEQLKSLMKELHSIEKLLESIPQPSELDRR